MAGVVGSIITVWALALTVFAMIAMFRLRLGVLKTLAASVAAGCFLLSLVTRFHAAA